MKNACLAWSVIQIIPNHCLDKQGGNRKGPQHIELFSQIPGVRISAICDCDTAHMDQAVAGMQNKKVKRYQDVRDCLADSEIDAVVIATPNHWHALMTEWACQAGKDVYVEKPGCHTLWEGRQMVQAARQYGRIVQAGTQNRSDVGLQAARKFLHNGGLGKIRLARTFDFTGIRAISKTMVPNRFPQQWITISSRVLHQ